MTALLVALGGGLGTAVRYLAGHLLDRVVPWGTLLANVAGSVLLGLLAGPALDGDARALLGAGFCGGLTTFSALLVQSSELARGRWSGTGRRRRLLAASYLLGSVLLAVAGCAAGVALAR